MEAGPFPFTPERVSRQEEKGPELVGALFFFLAVSPSEQGYNILFAGDSHRVRGVSSVVALLSPVESSILPSEALGAHTLLVRLGVGACKRILGLPRRQSYPLPVLSIVL
jgi:hypothetical protein